MADMTNTETARHIREWVKTTHGHFAWCTDACGYKQHLRFVSHRNAHWDAAASKGMSFEDFCLDYAKKLEEEGD